MVDDPNLRLIFRKKVSEACSGLCEAGAFSLESVKWMALAGTIGWFIATPIWMNESPVETIEKD